MEVSSLCTCADPCRAARSSQAASHQYPNHHHAGLGVTDEAFAHHGPPHPHQQQAGRRAHLLPLDPRQPDTPTHQHQHTPGQQDEHAASALARGAARGAHVSTSATRLQHGQHAHSHPHAHSQRQHHTVALLYDRAASVAAGGAGVTGERGNPDEGAGGVGSGEAAGAMGGGPQAAAYHHAGVQPSLAHAPLRFDVQQQRLPDLLLLQDRGSPAPQPAQLQVGSVGVSV